MFKTSNKSGLGRFAPYVCIAMLAGLFFAGGLQASTPKGADDYRARVRKAIDAIPYKIGPAVGSDVEPTRAAILLLSPNKIFQRRYVDPSTGWSQSLLIVHCKDVRDMTGHYPPNCYPAHGWRSQGAERAPIQLDGESAEAMVFRFSRPEEITDRRMIVFDFFIIPDEGGTIFADMEEMDRAARASKVGGLGVAQVQIVLDEDSSPQWRETMVRESLLAVAPAVKVIGQGVKR
jgi:hypothetical protein